MVAWCQSHGGACEHQDRRLTEDRRKIDRRLTEGCERAMANHTDFPSTTHLWSRAMGGASCLAGKLGHCLKSSRRPMLRQGIYVEADR